MRKWNVAGWGRIAMLGASLAVASFPRAAYAPEPPGQDDPYADRLEPLPDGANPPSRRARIAARVFACGLLVIGVGLLGKWTFYPEVAKPPGFTQYFRDPSGNQAVIDTLDLKRAETIHIEVAGVGRARGNATPKATYLVRVNLHYFYWVHGDNGGAEGRPRKMVLAESDTITIDENFEPGKLVNVGPLSYDFTGTQLHSIMRGNNLKEASISVELVPLSVDLGNVSSRLRWRSQDEPESDVPRQSRINLHRDTFADPLDQLRQGPVRPSVSTNGAWADVRISLRK